MSNNGIKDEENGWMPQISNLDEFNIFVDELTMVVDEIAELPYGILAVIACCLKDIKAGVEEDLDPSDFGLYEKMYYFIAGAMLTKTEKELHIKHEDLEILSNILDVLSTKISLMEGFYAGLLDAKFIEGEWMYGMTKDQAERYVTFYRNL